MNIASHLTAMAACQPWRPAVIFPQTRDGHGRVCYTHYTFQQLDETSGRLALGFLRLGIQRGMRVALMVPPCLDFFALTFALFKLGAVPVLIDPGIGLPSLGKGLAEAEPEAFIGVLKAHAARVLLGWCRNTLRIKVTVGGRALCGGATLSQVRHLGALGSPLPAVQLEPSETAAILFTSGSTGPSKGVVYTHEHFAAQVDHIRQLYGIQPGEIDLPTFPLFALFAPALGMTAILPDMDPTRPAQVDPAKLVEAIQNFGVTNMFGSPAVIRRLGRYAEQTTLKLPSLRRVISAGAPVSAKELGRFSRLLTPGVQVFTPYGATECLPVSSIGSDEILGETRHRTDLGRGVCVGRPVPGLIVKIIRISDASIPAWDQALEVQPGDIGEIAVKGTHVTRAYFNREHATTSAKIMDGCDGGFYHRMGDVGWLDASGRIWFCGRKSHRVVAPQGTFHTIPCEAIFNTHPSVFRSALVGVQRGSETEPVICVELEPEARANLESLTAELRELAAKHPHTRPIRRFLVHRGFPVDIRHNAKIFREKLAIWASRQNL